MKRALAVACASILFASSSFALNSKKLSFCDKDFESGQKYPIALLRVVDGDTQDVLIYVGFDVLVKKRLRLIGVDTPEKFGETKEKGLKATKFSKDWYANHLMHLAVSVVGTGKYGRPLAYVYDRETGETLNEALLKSGNARLYCGGKKEEL